MQGCIALELGGTVVAWYRGLNNRLPPIHMPILLVLLQTSENRQKKTNADFGTAVNKSMDMNKFSGLRCQPSKVKSSSPLLL